MTGSKVCTGLKIRILREMYMVSARTTACALLAAAIIQMPAAFAAEDGGQLHIGVSGGTLGISPEVGYRFGEHLGVRANGGFFNYDRNENIDDIDYDGTLKLNSVGVLADWFPFGGSFRISAGARSSSNKIDLTATPTVAVEIGDQFYDPDEIGTLSGGVSFKKLAPTASLGWGGKFKSGFAVGFELGVVMQGSPKFDLAASGGTLSSDPTFLAELEDERAQAEEDAEDFKFWPVLQLHFLYRF
jgi:hypothetical protein